MATKLADPKTALSFRLASPHLSELDALAEATNRNRSELIGEAIRIYLDVQRWQLEEIERSITEANAGDFASSDEVDLVFSGLAKS